MEDVVVKFFRDDTGGAPVLVEGLPGIGHVGKLVADHLIDELGGEKIAEISSVHFPPQVVIDEQGVTHLVNNEIYRCEKDGLAILFLVGISRAPRPKATTSWPSVTWMSPKILASGGFTRSGGTASATWSSTRGCSPRSIWSASGRRWRRPGGRLRTPGAVG